MALKLKVLARRRVVALTGRLMMFALSFLVMFSSSKTLCHSLGFLRHFLCAPGQRPRDQIKPVTPAICWKLATKSRNLGALSTNQNHHNDGR